MANYVSEPKENNNEKRRGIIKQLTDKATGKVADRIVENLSAFVVKATKSKFGIDFYFMQYDKTMYSLIEKWLYKKDPIKYSKNTMKLEMIKTNTKNGEASIPSLAHGSYFIRLEEETGTFCHVKCVEEKDEKTGEHTKYIKLYIFGKRYKKYVNELCNHVNKFTTKSNKLSVYKCSDKNGGWPRSYRVGKRTFDSIFIDKNTKTEIVNFVTKWRKNKSLFTSRGLNYKSGVMLHGDPGTGKTTIAKAIAAEINANLLIIDLTSINKIDIEEAIRIASDYNTKPVVILLEDIDCIVGKRDDPEYKMSEDEKKALNTILQLLDGVNDISNVIFVATTNHYDRLDWALIRPSRFDIKPEICALDLELAREMCESFGIDPSEVLDPEMTSINPSELQDKLLKYIMGTNKSNTDEGVA